MHQHNVACIDHDPFLIGPKAEFVVRVETDIAAVKQFTLLFQPRARADGHAQQVIAAAAVTHSQHTGLTNIPQALHKFFIPILHW